MKFRRSNQDKNKFTLIISASQKSTESTKIMKSNQDKNSDDLVCIFAYFGCSKL